MPPVTAPGLGRGLSRRRERAPQLSNAQEAALLERQDAQQDQQVDQGRQTGLEQRQRATGRTHPGEAPHAALSWSVQGVYGNALMQGALSGRGTGPGQMIEGAMTLGAAGIAVADSVEGLLSNSAVADWMHSYGNGVDGVDGASVEGAALGADAGVSAPVSRRSGSGGEVFSDDAPRKLDTALSRGGRPLPADLSARLETAFGGVDFSTVRIHTDGAAAQASDAIRAHAFAVGTDIYFNRGAWSPQTPAGQHLLAHELTHVVQYMEGRLRPGSSNGDLDVSSPTDPHEIEAEARAAEVTRALGSGAVDDAMLAQDQGVDVADVGVDAAASIGGMAVADSATDLAGPDAGDLDVGDAGSDVSAGDSGADGAVSRRAFDPSKRMGSGLRQLGAGRGDRQGPRQRGGGQRSGGGRPGGGQRGGQQGGGLGGQLGGFAGQLDGGMGIVSQLLEGQAPSANDLLATLQQVFGDELSIDGSGVQGLAKALAAALGGTGAGAAQTQPGGPGVGEGPTGAAGGGAGGGGGSPSANKAWSVKKGSAGAGRGDGSGAGVRLEGDVAAFGRDLVQTVVVSLGQGGSLDSELIWARMSELFPDQMDPQTDLGVEGRDNEETSNAQAVGGARPDGPKGEQIAGGFQGGGDITRRGQADPEGFDPVMFVQRLVGQFNTLGEGDVGPLVQQVIQGEIAAVAPGIAELIGAQAGRGGPGGPGGPGGGGLGGLGRGGMGGLMGGMPGGGGGMGGVSGLLADALPMPSMGGPGQAVGRLAGGIPAPAIEGRMADCFGPNGGGRGRPPNGFGHGQDEPLNIGFGPGQREPGTGSGAPNAPYSNTRAPDWDAQPGGVTARGEGRIPRLPPRPGAQGPVGPGQQEEEEGPGTGGPTGGEEEQTGGDVVAPTGELEETGGGSLDTGPQQTGGGTDQAPTVDTGSGPSREVDGMVDYYMETHWDRAEFDAKVAEYGVLPEQLGTELDQWLPAQTSEGVRSGLNLAFGIGGGLLDAVFVGVTKSLPLVGTLSHVAYGIKDIWTAHETYKEVEGGRGAWLYALNITRDIANMVGGVAGNLADTCTLIQDALIASVIGAELAPIPAAIGEVLSAIALGTDGAKVIFDGISAVLNIVEAQEAERQGDFRRAAKHRELARGDVMTGIVDTIGLVASSISMLSVNTLPGELPENMAEVVKNAATSEAGALGTLIEGAKTRARSGATGVSSSSGLKTTKNQVARWNSPAGAALGMTQSWNNLLYNIGLGDAMKLSPDGLFGGHYIEPGQLSGSGSVTGAMSAARESTVAEFQATWAELEGNDPSWHQTLLNAVLNPGGIDALGVYSEVLSPSAWIRRTLQGIRFVDTLIDDSSKEAAAGSLRLIASGLDTIAQPGIEALNSLIDEMEPGIDAMLENLADAMTQNQVSLEAVRNGVGSVQELMTWISQLADTHGSISQGLDDAIARIGRMHIDPDSFDIPWWVPEFTYSWAIDAINSGVAELQSGAQSLKDSALEEIDEFLDGITTWAQEQLDGIQQVIAEGGELEMMMQQSYEEFAAAAAAIATAIAEWDMGVHIDLAGTVDWLASTADQIESTESAARLQQFKDYLAGEAQAYVDDWKAQYADDVDQAYHPNVPAAELTAATAAFSAVNEKLDQLQGQGADVSDQRAQAAEAWATIQAHSGNQGQEALEGFWSGCDALARVASSLGL